MQETKSVLKLTTNNFSETIKNGITLVDFWAEWCGPCRMQGPIIEGAVSKVGDNVNIGKLNVDENPEIARDFGITGIPTIIVFKDGREAKRLVGVQSEASLLNTVDSLA
jgi:thioredoxin 1